MSFISRNRKYGKESRVAYLFKTQTTGRGITRLQQLPEDLVEELQEKFEEQNVPSVIQELDNLSAGPKTDTFRCLDSLKEIHAKLTNFEARRSNDESNLDEDQIKFAKLFVHYGGDDLLVRLVMFITAYSEAHRINKEPEVHLRIKSVSLEILTKLISIVEIGEALSKKLTQNNDMMMYAFTLLAHKKTHMTACQFLEDLLQARKTVLNLNTVPDIRRLITHGLDDEKLANFCRVLSVTISDLDIYENKSSLYAQNKQKRSKGFINVRDINQEFLLSIPNLLERLVRIATKKDYSPRFMGMGSELDCWMMWIENSMADAAFDLPIIDDFDEFIGGISVQTSPSGPMVQQAGLKISMDLIKRVQVVYVLGLFLVGKHRKKTQKALAELGIVPAMCEVFDQFIWKCNAHRNNTRHRLRGHNASCECSPEVALKIQFLRLVHSFCDHSDYKHLLLSKSELLEIRRINTKAGPLMVEGLEDVNKSLMCKGSKGLLSKIIDVMKKEPTASTFRFWLARAVESYLRGTTSFCDQVFLLRRGLLEHIAGNIVDHDIRPKEILQSSFDLLGELIKFNIEAFRLFEKVFVTKAKFEKFISIVNRSLVDSNMFLRSLILSYEHFITVQSEHKQYSKEDNRLLMHIGKFEQQMEYLTKLINIINVQNLTQENVSCLNTSLVFLMFANQKSELPYFLRAMAKTPVDGTCAATTTSPIMKNFRDLLVFWQDHYLHKDKDCSALEKSSRVPFDYWKQTVSTLVSEDRNLNTAIIHYMDPDTCTARNN